MGAFMRCPICRGDGEIKKPASRKQKVVKPAGASQAGIRLQLRTEMAKKLREQGFSLREIAKLLGYKSPRSVQLCLARED